MHLTADHGNVDQMLDEDGSANTAHSLNPVPLVVTAGAQELGGRGILADVAPPCSRCWACPSRRR